MKLSVAVFSTALGLAAAKKSKNVTPKTAIKATSKVGTKMMSKARRLEQNENEEIDFTWVANMSLKFQGCYHTQSWNDEAGGEEDIRISTQRLVRFRLCPSDSCSMESAAGCSAGYGDYIISMEEYLEAYFESVQQDQEYSCEYEKEYGDCACDGENADDGFDEEICEYDCYMAKGMEYCVDRNPYAEEGEEEEEEEMELREMAECQRLEVEDNNNNRARKLEEEEEVEYYVGAYCSDSGASIHLGVFTEESCSQFADEYGGAATYAQLTYGKELPYAETTMIGSECMSCKEPEDANQNNDNDNQDEDQVKEGCEQLYEGAGKCEGNLGIQYPNNYGCNFMEGIKIVRKNGTIVRGPGSKNGTASVFIGLFACSFVLLGGYAYYLKTKLDRAKVNLVSEE